MVRVVSVLKLIIFFCFFSTTWLIGRYINGVSIGAIEYTFILLMASILFFNKTSLTIKHDLESIFAIVILIYMLLSLLWSISVEYTIRESVGVVFVYMMYILFRKYAVDFSFVSYFYKLSLMLFIISLIYIVIAILIGVYGKFTFLESEATDMQYIFFVSPTLVSILGFLTYAYMRSGVYIFYKKILIAIIFLVVFYFLLNMSKTYLLAFIFSLFCFEYLKTNFLYRLLLMILFFILLYLILFTDNPISRQLYWNSISVDYIFFFSHLDDIGSVINFNGRLNLWQYIISTSHNSWVLGSFLGSGFGTSRYILEGTRFAETGSHFAHGDYARIICELGYLGLLIYIIGILFFIKKNFSKYKVTNDKYLRFTYSSIVLLLIYILFVGIGYEAINKFTTLWLVLALLIATSHNYSSQRS